MNHTYNTLGQPIGLSLNGWIPPKPPALTPMEGRYCRLEPLDAAAHAAELYAANRAAPDDGLWTYLAYGPFACLESYTTWVKEMSAMKDPLFFAIRDRESGLAVGVAAYLRIAPAYGTIEVGHINYSPQLQQTRAATEAMFLMMERAFETGYRRYEWKCDALNARSRAAAQRLGLSYEGIFRQATVYKGRSRDTAWYAAIDREWPALRAAFQQWLDPANFDAEGRQLTRLGELTGPILVQRG